ncbi:hypothetical protein L1987_78107 [Smallanthus sonchifolius]|uniref:Uncharacterized protein n=1 Tax=Smallanthus sonchifolius TaxID=185202 RepID=A0ACB8ZBS7_9ASTR|nr:hypothetical protein L1987_78107 [Smallanthus sonchifolius]
MNSKTAIAVLAHIILREKLHIFGILGCVLCVVGSTTIVLHAPQERPIESVTEVWDLATEPAFVLYAALVMSVKAIGIALKLTLSGMNQLVYPQTWAFTLIVLLCVITQMNYLNKDWDRQNPTQIITEMCGFVTILSGTFLLHKTKDMVDDGEIGFPISLPRNPFVTRSMFSNAPTKIKISCWVFLKMVDGPVPLSVRPPKHMEDDEDGIDHESIPLTLRR